MADQGVWARTSNVRFLERIYLYNLAVRFTCSGLADGLTDTIDFACRMGVEVPFLLKNRASFWSLSVVFCFSRSGARIQKCLGIVALRDRD